MYLPMRRRLIGLLIIIVGMFVLGVISTAVLLLTR
jgi:hypothetical protein